MSHFPRLGIALRISRPHYGNRQRGNRPPRQSINLTKWMVNIMAQSIYPVNRPFTVRIPAPLKKSVMADGRGAMTTLITALIMADYKKRVKRKSPTDAGERPATGDRVRMSVNAVVDDDIAPVIREFLDAAGIKPRDYVTELLAAHHDGRKPVFPARDTGGDDQ